LAIPTDSRVIDLDRALGRLEKLDSRAAQVVELRFFGGLTDNEVGKALSISPATVKRDWDFARSWLLNQM
jgi:RNA polymerase sigma factor (sigma-70 family)